MKHPAVLNFIFGLIIFLFSESLVGQNLVRNPGFEEYKKIPVTFCRSAKEFNATVKDWSMPNEATADYFHAKCKANASTIKNNFAGFQRAEEGDAYAGIYCYMGNGSYYSEYLKTKLIKPLEAGQRYTVQFYVSLSEASEFAIDRLGVLFMKENLVQKNLFPLNYKATVESPDSIFYDDKEEWKQIRLSFVANGGEKYMIIGNFHCKGDGNLEKVLVNKKKYYKENGTYYYIDDVCVAPEDENGNCFCPVQPPPDSATIAARILKAKKDSLARLPKISKTPPVTIKTETPKVLTTVFFDTDKSELKPESFPALDSLAEFLMSENDYKIKISGYTDNSGDENKNQKLSQDRAKAVADYLVQKGVPANRINSEGLGSSNPIADNATPEGRAKNRRVEYVLHK